jgi:hypothetical protein
MDPCLEARHIVTQHLRLLKVPSITGVEPQAIVPVDCLQRLMDEHIPRLTDWRVELTLGHGDQDGLYQSGEANARSNISHTTA